MALNLDTLGLSATASNIDIAYDASASCSTANISITVTS